MATEVTSGPLKGVKVIELGGFIAGPYAASLFAQFGADVIKVEPPGEGDPLRRWRKLHNGTSLWWYSLSRNKKSIALNLKSDEGRRILRALLEKADVLVENFRPGTLEGWGLGWDELSRINPGLVLVRISGYGQTGPYRDRPGFGAIAEAVGGLRYITGYPDRAPVRVGVSLGDTLAALLSRSIIATSTAARDRLSTPRCTRRCSRSQRACCLNTRKRGSCASVREQACPAFHHRIPTRVVTAGTW